MAAKRQSSGNLGKAFFLILLIIVLIIVGSILIDLVANMAGVGINLNIPIITNMRSKSLKKKIRASEDPFLLRQEELNKWEQRLELLEEQQINEKNEIDKERQINDKKLETLKEKETELNKKAEFLDQRDRQWEDKQQNIREQAVKLYNMPPADAVNIIEKQTEADIVDILRAIDAYSEEQGQTSTSPYLLSLLSQINNEKAANLHRKLKFAGNETRTAVEEDDEIE